MNEQNFDKMLKFILQREGGYVNDPNDLGGETNKGITHNTYSSYRKSKGLPQRSVKYITDDEVRDIYYNNYFKASGADKIENPQLASYVFDTAVNMGVSRAKSFLEQSNGNPDTFEKLRRAKYAEFAKVNPSQQRYLQGWNNRVTAVKNFTQNSFPDWSDDQSITQITPNPATISNPTESYTYDFNTPYKLQIEKNEYLPSYADIPFADPVNTHIFTPQEIGNMTREEFEQNLPIIEQQLKDGLIRPQSEQPKDYSNYKNPETGTEKIYTREDISKMSTKEYSKNEKEIMAQMNSIGIPYKNDLPSNVKTHEKEKSYPTSSENADGKWITINGNHVLIKD